MVNSEDFGKRIQILMDYYALSASAFADSLAIGRSSISHILSGRNKPSLDFVLKIVERYDEVAMEWLLSGKGVFPKSKENFKTTADIAPTISSTDDTPENSSVGTTTAQDLFNQTVPDSPIGISENTHANQPPSSQVSTTKEIDRIVIFYADGTFSSYLSKKS